MIRFHSNHFLGILTGLGCYLGEVPNKLICANVSKTKQNKKASAHKEGCINCSRAGIGAQNRETIFLDEEEK